jgi:PAS domain-containing protein
MSRSEDSSGTGAAASARGVEIEAAYDAAPVGLCVLDADLRYVRVNSRLAEMHAAPARAHIGRSPGAVLPWLADGFEPLARHVLDTGVPVIRHSLTTAPDSAGMTRRWQVSLCALRAPDGRITGVSGVVQNVSEDATVEHLASVIRALPSSA